MAWWTLYPLWLQAVGVGQPAKGNHTTFEYWQPELAKMLPFTARSTRLAALTYMVLHATAVTLSFVVALVNFYSYTLFTIYLILLALSACWQGASRYNYYMVDSYETKMANALSPPPTIREKP